MNHKLRHVRRAAGALAILLLCGRSGHAAPKGGGVRQSIREVVVDPATQVHSVRVTGWPGLTTSIQFSDSFESTNVLCAECLEVAPGEAEASQAVQPQDPRNWVIEKRPVERSIHLRPHRLPQVGNPASGFATNVYILLGGGHAINIELSLLQPERAAQALSADAVVTIKLPKEATLGGKLAQERLKLEQGLRSKTACESHRLFLQRLAGVLQCQPVRWRRPHRSDRSVVRLDQVCLSAGAQKTFWVRFELENRSAAALYVEGVALEPEAAVAVHNDPVTFFVDTQTLRYGEKAHGVALTTLDAQAEVPSSWRLVINPASPDREPVHIAGIVF